MCFIGSFDSRVKVWYRLQQYHTTKQVPTADSQTVTITMQSNWHIMSRNKLSLACRCIAMMAAPHLVRKRASAGLAPTSGLLRAMDTCGMTKVAYNMHSTINLVYGRSFII